MFLDNNRMFFKKKQFQKFFDTIPLMSMVRRGRPRGTAEGEGSLRYCVSVSDYVPDFKMLSLKTCNVN